MLTKAFILAAGEGTRMRPLTDRWPKPMLPIGGRPALGHILDWLRSHGVCDVAINLHYQGDAIAEHFGDGCPSAVRITYSREPELLGSAGALRALPEFFDRPVVVVYGDVLTDLDLHDLYAVHEAHRRAGAPHVTLSLYHVARPQDCGIVALDGEGRVTCFVEKPHPDEVFSDLANAGVLIVEPELVSLIPPGVAYDIGCDWLPQLLAAGVPVYGWVVPPEAYLVDFGTPEAYARAGREWPRRVAVFLDRDGVINENRDAYVRAWEHVRFLPGSLEALRHLAAMPVRIVIVSNQSVVNRGLADEEIVRDINARLSAAVTGAGGRVDGMYYCPHRPDEGCECRKPRPGLLRRAAKELGLSLRRSYLVGDNLSDLQAAWAAGAQAVLVRTGLGAEVEARLTAADRERCAVLDDLAAAARWIASAEACGQYDD